MNTFLCIYTQSHKKIIIISLILIKYNTYIYSLFMRKVKLVNYKSHTEINRCPNNNNNNGIT
jgi:hypothetical protein